MKVYSQIIGAAFENKSSDYGAAGVIGRFWWNTTAQQLKWDDGTTIRNILTNNQKCIFGTNATANNNIRLNRAAAEVLQLVKGGDTTAEGTLSANLAQLSSKIENYTDAGKPAAAAGNTGRLVYITDLQVLKLDIGGTYSTLATNTAADRLGAIYNAVVGSAAQVLSGVATHSSINTAIGALSAGQSMYILDGTFTENVSLDKALTIQGKGLGTVISGTWTFTSGSDESVVKDLKITDNITFNSGAVGNFLMHVFQSTGKTITDNGTSNFVLAYRE